MALITCPKCEKQISDTSKKCIHCGSQFTICPECGKILEGSPSECSNCGFVFNETIAVTQNEAQKTNSQNVTPENTIKEGDSPAQEPDDIDEDGEQKDLFTIINNYHKTSPAGRTLKYILKISSGIVITLVVTSFIAILSANGFFSSLFEDFDIINFLTNLYSLEGAKALSGALIIPLALVLLYTIWSVPLDIIKKCLISRYVRNSDYSIKQTVKKLEKYDKNEYEFKEIAQISDVIKDLDFFVLSELNPSSRGKLIFAKIFDYISDMITYSLWILCFIIVSLSSISISITRSLATLVILITITSVIGFINSKLSKSCEEEAKNILKSLSDSNEPLATGKNAAGAAAGASPELLQELSRKIHTSSTLWLVSGIIQLISVVFSIFGIINIVIATKKRKYSKEILENPKGIVNDFQSSGSAVGYLVYHILVGNIIGIIGSVIYLNSARKIVLENKEYFNNLK